jgi:hypothetical protein
VTGGQNFSFEQPCGKRQSNGNFFFGKNRDFSDKKS